MTTALRATAASVCLLWIALHAAGCETTGPDDLAARHAAILEGVELAAAADEVVLDEDRVVETSNDGLGPRSSVHGRVFDGGAGTYAVFVCEDGVVRRRADFNEHFRIITDWCEIALQPTCDGGFENTTRDYYRGDMLGCESCPYEIPGDMRCYTSSNPYQRRSTRRWDANGWLQSDYWYSGIKGYGSDSTLEEFEYSNHGTVLQSIRTDVGDRRQYGTRVQRKTQRWTFSWHGLRKVQTEIFDDDILYYQQYISTTTDTYQYTGPYPRELDYLIRVHSSTRQDRLEDTHEAWTEIVEDPEPEYPPDISDRHLDAYCSQLVPLKFLDPDFEWPPGGAE